MAPRHTACRRRSASMGYSDKSTASIIAASNLKLLESSSHDVELDALEMRALLPLRPAPDDDARECVERAEERGFQPSQFAFVDDQDAFVRTFDRRPFDRHFVEIRATRSALRVNAASGDEGLVDPQPLQVLHRLVREESGG